MSLIQTALIGTGLSMDAAAVTVANMLGAKGIGRRKWAMPCLFGLFQGGMLLAGYMAGSLFASHITAFAPYAMLTVLGILGIKMIYDALFKRELTNGKPQNLSFFTLLAQAVATSLDALVVGVAVAASGQSALIPVLSCAVITFALCTGAMYAGHRGGALLKEKAPLWGGVILLLLAILSMFK